MPAIALAAGAAAGVFAWPSYFPEPSRAIPACFLACAASAFIARQSARATLALIACGFAAAGLSLGRHADLQSRDTPLGRFFDAQAQAEGAHQLFASVEGVLAEDARRGPSGVTLALRVERVAVGGVEHDVSGGALIGVSGVPDESQILQWRAGRRVALPAMLRRPSRYLNPGVPDAVRLMAWRGTALVGSTKSARLVEIVEDGRLAAEAAASARAYVRDVIRGAVAPLSARSAVVVSAILIGDRAGLDEPVERRLQEAGTYHVIAISGGNIAIIAAIGAFLFRFAGAGPRTVALGVIGTVAGYAAVVHGGSSVGRAALMAIIYFAARLFDHATPPLNAAAIAVVVLLCADPLQIADAGFALTVGATLAIITGAPRIGEAFSPPSWLRPPSLLLAASLCAEIALLPIGALVFSRVTFAGLLVNFAAVPAMAVVQIAGLAAVALAAVSPGAAGALGWVAHLGVEGLVGSAVLVDWFPWLSRRVAPPPIVVAAAYYACVVLAVVAWRRGRSVRHGLLAGAVAAAVWIVLAPAPPGGGSASLRVTFLDVGQGDAAAVQFPNGRSLVIDAGGSANSPFDIGGRVVSPALWALGLRRLDYLAITHGDGDHIGGAASVFRDFAPFEVWDGVPVPPHLPTRELRMLADASRASWRTVGPPHSVNIGGVQVIAHHPPVPEWERQRVRNDDSIVVELRYRHTSFVFTGDIGRETEALLLRSFAPAGIRVVKVPHHGSASSSTRAFIAALRPDIAVISAGRGNPFGHPMPAVVDRYREAGAALYRTDQDGAVTIETDGTTVRVRTFTGRRLTVSTRE